MPTIKKLYFSSGVAVTPATDLSTGGGSGSGELNVVANPNDAESGWTATGSGITVATSTLSTDIPLGGIISNSIKITPVSGTSDYVYYRFTMSESLKGRKLKIQWEQRPLSGYASGDLKLEMHTNTASNYAGTDATLSLTTDDSGVTSIPKSTGRFTAYFEADSSDYYELRIKRVSGTTALNIANVIVGPGIQPQGSISTGWITPSTGATFRYGTTIATNLQAGFPKCKYRRIGDSIDLDFSVVFNGAANATGAMYFYMPDNLSINSSSMPNGLVDQATGLRASIYTNGKIYGGAIDFDESGRFYIRSVDGAGATITTWTGNTTAGSNVPSGAALANNDYITVSVRGLPIAEWSGGGTVNTAQNDVEYAYNTDVTDADNTTAFGYGPLGVQFGSLTAARSKTVRFQTPHQDGDQYQIEIWDTTAWFVLGAYSDSVIPLATQNTTQYGMTLNNSSSSTTDLIVNFGQYRITNGATYASAGGAWSGIAGSANFKWRVKKIKGGQAVGFGLVASDSSGLMPSNHSNLDNSAATRLGLKEYLHGTTYNGGNAPTITGQAGFAADTRCVFIPYQMQSGTWRMRFNVRFSQTSGTTADISINGVTFNKVAPVAVSGNNLAAANYAGRTTDASSSIVLRSSSADTIFSVSGDVELSSKPNWAY